MCKSKHLTSDSTLNNVVQESDVSDHSADCIDQEQGNKKSPLSDHIPSSSCSPMHAEDMVITDIRATDLALGLRRIPAGFYVVVQHSDLEWRTENKCSSISDDIVEWNGPIPMCGFSSPTIPSPRKVCSPSDLFAIVRFDIYASFEFQHKLGNGEQLRKLTTTVEQLLDRGAKDYGFTFFPKDGDVVSPCSSLLVTIRKRKRESSDLSPSRVIDLHYSTREFRGQLEIATDEGHSDLSRYRKHGQKQDLKRSIEQFERALNICPPGHPCHAAALSNLATAKFILCMVDDIDISLDVPLRLYRDSLSARPVGHVDRPLTLIQLASVHFVRFEKLQNEADAAQAENLLQEVMDSVSADSHECQAASRMLQLHAGLETSSVDSDVESEMQDSASDFTYEDQWTLALRLLEHFGRSGDLDDLQQAISLLEGLVELTSFWDPLYPVVLQNFGVALLQRFRRLGEETDLEQAISRIGDAANFTPDDDPNTPALLRLGEPDDLERAILRLEDAVRLTPDGHLDKPARLNNLGISFVTRFEHLGEFSDLERAISTLGDVINLTPDDHPGKPTRLSNLGTSLVTRFERLGELSDIERAISALGDAVELTPSGQPDKPGRLNNLGTTLKIRFERRGDLSDLEQAIMTQRDAVDLTPDGHPYKPTLLNNLGTSLLTRFESLGKLVDLEHAISILEEAVNLTPDSHPDKPGRLNNLSTSLLTRFSRLGSIIDLERAISKSGDAVNLTPDHHPLKPAFLNNLGTSFRTRFERFGELSDLERAITSQGDAVNLTPDGHPGKPARLDSLGTSFATRFERLGEIGDLERAISRFEYAVSQTPDSQPDKLLWLNNLSTSLRTRFEHLEELSDLERAISLLGDAVSLIPDDHPGKPTWLNNLGTSFRARFEHLGELGDLGCAISFVGSAVDLTPDGHPDRPGWLNSDGSSFLARFKHLGQLSDLERAISRFRDAVNLTPDGHPNKPASLNNLGTSFRTRFEHFGEVDDLERAISWYSQSASHSMGPATVRFDASLGWISCARASGHHSLLHAYSVSVELLPQLAWMGLSLTHRYRELEEGADIVREAAAAALESGYLQTAVEWLEQGRSIVWGELFQLRSSFDQLSAVHPDHARRLRELSTELEQAGATRESLSSQLDVTQAARHGMTRSLEKEVDRHRMLAIERDKLLQEIRGLPGFERFLHKEFSQLRASAHSGPVVIPNAAESHFDALIILADVEDVIRVPLPNFTLQRSESLQSSMKSLVRHAQAIPVGERIGHRVPLQEIASQWESILSSLWKCAVKPVLHSLALEIPGKQSRIFWCPTGPLTFFPIHAAGFYDAQYSQPGYKVFDFVVSSYVPTLSILAPSPELEAASNGDLHFLAVPQPPSDGLSHLPGVDAELRHIRTIIRSSPSAKTTLRESSSGTVEEVLDLMREADWVHFACHGIQDAANPTDSGLCLANERRLALPNIIALSRPRGGLAFLSACQTATGDKELSDEAIHIAAGMLFAGYGGVVGTMWSISDRLAPVVAKDLYGQLLSNGTRPDYREAARALQEAVGRLRDNGASFLEWIPFIHVGL